MARFSLLSRIRRHGGDDPLPESLAERRPLTARRAAPTPGALRRERRALLKAREERIRDLGGLMLEMYRRDHYREELVFEQCAELVALEERILELDALVAASAAGRPAVATRCSCGAPLYGGVHFCPNCGRPTGEAVVRCEQCGHPLPADAQFCAACGAPASGAGADGAYDEGGDSNGADPAAPEPEPALDPWER
jgi:double zinc ribbon protein